MKQSYGVLDFFQISTYTIPWLVGVVLQDTAPNIEFKSTLFNRKRLALSASISFITGTFEQVENVSSTRIRYYMTPLSVASSVRINRDISTHIGGIYTATQGDANAGLGTSDIGGSAVIDLLQFWGMVEWRLSRVVAFTFTVRWVPWVSDTIVSGTLEGNPEIGVDIQLEFIDLTNAFAAIPGFVFSWERANIRMGVGYGDFFSEFLGFPLAIPGDLFKNIAWEFDVFVRF